MASTAVPIRSHAFLPPLPVGVGCAGGGGAPTPGEGGGGGGGRGGGGGGGDDMEGTLREPAGSIGPSSPPMSRPPRHPTGKAVRTRRFPTRSDGIPGSDLDLELFEAAEDEVLPVAGFGDHLDVGSAPDQGFERDLTLEPGQ